MALSQHYFSKYFRQLRRMPSYSGEDARMLSIQEPEANSHCFLFSLFAHFGSSLTFYFFQKDGEKIICVIETLGPRNNQFSQSGFSSYQVLSEDQILSKITSNYFPKSFNHCFPAQSILYRVKKENAYRYDLALSPGPCYFL